MNKKSISTYIFVFVILLASTLSCKSKDCGCPGTSSISTTQKVNV
ncbi:MAG: hypothetical protein ACPG6V_06480 [Flavobacteriales bacterium]